MRYGQGLVGGEDAQAGRAKLAREVLTGTGRALDLDGLVRAERDSEVDEETMLLDEVAPVSRRWPAGCAGFAHAT